MNNNLEQLGISLIMQGTNAFARGAADYGKQVGSMNKATAGYSKEADKSKKSSDAAAQGFSAAGKGAEAGAKGVGILGAAIQFALSPITLIISAIAAAGAAMFQLGLRGAEIRGIETAFANLVSPVLKSGESVQDFVNNLRQAAGDTIAQVELLKSTNLALAGTSGELRDTFARSLPRLLEIARVQAAATGESVAFLFDSLVRGIKRGSPLIIDNTGLVLDLTKANQALAEQLGISVDQLTEEQKTIALINATVAAGAQAIEAAGGIQVTAATRLATIQSLITNTIDNIAKGVEPLVSAFLGFITPVFSAIETATRSLGSLIQAVSDRIGSFVQNTSDRIANFVGTFQTAFAIAQQTIQQGGEVISRGFVGQMAAGAAQLFQIFSQSITNTLQFLIGAIPNFVKGGASLFAALGNAYLAAANRFIFPVVVQIATFIADFLTGFSPAKRGPLSRIDEGAAGLAQSWANSFAGVFVPTAKEVAEKVDAQLGGIGRLGIKAVEKRLGQLDLALRPFQENLAITKAQFEALQEPAKAALELIDKQLQRATEGLIAGDEASAVLTRQLNTQRAAVEKRLSLQEDELNNAQLGLALAQSQQAQERALLLIQQKRLGTTKEVQKAQEKTVKDTKEAVDKAPKGSGAAETKPVGTTGAGVNQAKVDEFIGNAGGNKALDLAMQGLDKTLMGLGNFAGELGADFLEGLAAGGELDTTLGFGEELQAQFARIAESSPVEGITGAFTGLTDGLMSVGREAVQGFLDFFTNPEMEGSIPFFINDLNNRGAAAVFGDLSIGISTWIQDSIITPIREGALAEFFDPMNPEGLYAPFWLIGTNLGIVLAETDFGAIMQSAFASIGLWARGEVEGGGLPAIIQSIIDSFSGLPNALFDAIQFIGLVFFDVFIAPFISVIDQFIAITNDFLNELLNSEFMNFLRSNPVTSSLFQDFPTSAQIDPLSSIINRGAFLPIRPAEIAQAATGGLFTGGLLDVHKDERIFSASPMGVLNKQFVSAMDNLSQMLLGAEGFGIGLPMPQTISNNSNVDNSVTVNSNSGFKQSAAEVANRIAVARIFGV